MTVSNAKEPQFAQNLNVFLQSVELKAYRMALFAVSEHADALDIVQDSMFKFVSNYAEKPREQWKPLFYRILQNKIRDWHRHQKVRSIVLFWKQDEESADISELPGANPSAEEQPETALDKNQLQDSVIQALWGLPEKQRQCFLLRSWEGCSVADTAIAMGCSQGSVKTHYFRAVNKLRDLLGAVHDIKI